jgi:hypothetical protein
MVLSFDSLGFMGGVARATGKVFQNWDDSHRDEWKWDKVTCGTHFIDWKRGFSPLEMVYGRADRAFVGALRNRFGEPS